jgi:Zn-dependent protease with chaperone function
MSPYLKYTLGRLALFVIVFVLLQPLPLNILVSAMVALLISAVLSYFLLARWREEMSDRLAASASRRSAEKERLRAALAGDEDAVAEGDRAGKPAPASPAAAPEGSGQPTPGRGGKEVAAAEEKPEQAGAKQQGGGRAEGESRADPVGGVG